MAMQGSLKEMMVSDLIQHACLEGETALITLENSAEAEAARLYIDKGQIVHAESGDQKGEEVVYTLLEWIDGTFTLEKDISPPTKSINQDYVALLLVGAKKLDEQNAKGNPVKEVKQMSTKKKGEMLAELLDRILSESTDLEGAAIVGTDGLVYSINIPSGKYDQDLVGAVAAALLGASRRSTDQLNRGNLAQTLIQGSSGNIIVTPLGQQTIFVALTSDQVNLGMAFAETRSAKDQLVEVV